MFQGFMFQGLRVSGFKGFMFQCFRNQSFMCQSLRVSSSAARKISGFLKIIYFQEPETLKHETLKL